MMMIMAILVKIKKNVQVEIEDLCKSEKEVNTAQFNSSKDKFLNIVLNPTALHTVLCVKQYDALHDAGKVHGVRVREEV